MYLSTHFHAAPADQRSFRRRSNWRITPGILLAIACLGLSSAVAKPWDPDFGNGNTGAGNGVLSSNVTGTNNSAFGFQALMFNTTGSFNSGIGSQSLLRNTTGNINTATGSQSLLNNTTGTANTADGGQALYNNGVGNENTAAGYLALFSNTTGNGNVSQGVHTLFSNTSGNVNAAVGTQALSNNSTGSFNTALGSQALNANTTGDLNIAVGFSAGSNLTTGINNIDIGNQGTSGESGTIRIGTSGNQAATFIAGINGTVVPTGVPVVVDANGQLGITVSSEKSKEAIKPMEKTSEAIYSLQPVTFRYQHRLDAKGTPQFGLVAEEVAKVSPDLVARDAEGKIYTVRYDAVNAMLLNEFLKEHRQVKELEKPSPGNRQKLRYWPTV